MVSASQCRPHRWYPKMLVHPSSHSYPFWVIHFADSNLGGQSDWHMLRGTRCHDSSCNYFSDRGTFDLRLISQSYPHAKVNRDVNAMHSLHELAARECSPGFCNRASSSQGCGSICIPSPRDAHACKKAAYSNLHLTFTVYRLEMTAYSPRNGRYSGNDTTPKALAI